MIKTTKECVCRDCGKTFEVWHWCMNEAEVAEFQRNYPATGNRCGDCVKALERTYDYEGYVPYGAADGYCLDSAVGDDFRGGNTVQAIIDAGLAKWFAASDEHAALVFTKEPLVIHFVKRPSATSSN